MAVQPTNFACVTIEVVTKCPFFLRVLHCLRVSHLHNQRLMGWKHRFSDEGRVALQAQ